MHRRLRRQLEESLGQERESSPHLRKLFRRIEKEYRRADDDRASLQRALGLLSDLLRRQPEAARRRGTSPKARAVLRLFEQAPFAALLCDADRKVTTWNPAAERLFGIPAAEALGRELSMLVFPDTDADRAEARTELRELLESPETLQSLRMTPGSGAPRMCEWTVVPLRDAKGREVGNAAVVQEADPLRDRYAIAWQASGDGIWDWDLGADRLWLSGSWRAIVGAAGEGDAPAEWLDRVHPSDREALDAAIRAHFDGQSPRFESEHRLRHEDGTWRWVLARGQATRDATGKAVRFSGSAMDVTDPKAGASRVSQDALTQLPNRTHFLELVERSLAHGRRREGYRSAVLFVDLDRFKSVNDDLGPAAGDELLVKIGERLKTCLRDGDVLARPGGDEFTILLDDVKEAGETELVADRIHQAIGQPFEVAGHEVCATASIGIAVSAPAYTRAEDLLLDADTAMYRAKAQGGARSAAFDAALRERAPQLVELEADLRRALAREEFRVHYLPIVDVATGRIQGLEALIRWAHPTLGLISPDQFMPLAEESGLIVPIGRWLLAQAGREFQGCRRGVASGELTLNVNLSTRQLQHPGLLQQIDGVLAEHGLDPQDLVVELTEKTLQHGDDATARIGELRDRGVRLYMDDFGTGSCSLSSLFRFQLDSLKIDRSLFTGGSPRGQAPELVRTIVAAARETGTHVVAEGVETADQLGFLREVGCGAAQGFYFSPPVDGTMARTLLARAGGW